MDSILDSSLILHILASVLFVLGVLAVIVRKNIIVVLMGVELILNAVNLSFVTFSKDLNHLSPQVVSVFIICLAAAESAIGLSIVVNVFRNFGTIQTDKINILRG